jgi:hypothetical protein
MRCQQLPGLYHRARLVLIYSPPPPTHTHKLEKNTSATAVSFVVGGSIQLAWLAVVPQFDSVSGCL